MILINPLPAYDIAHRIISPKDYEHCIVDAIVEIHLTLTHYLMEIEVDARGGSLITR